MAWLCVRWRVSCRDYRGKGTHLRPLNLLREENFLMYTEGIIVLFEVLVAVGMVWVVCQMICLSRKIIFLRNLLCKRGEQS
jgi:hypothetical protein